MRKLFLSLLIACILSCASASSADTTIMVASDLHYLSPSLYEGSALFLRSIAKGDGKLVQHSDILLRALIAQAERIHPDALVLTGDLTFNGEKQSHEDLAEALETLVHQGIPVYVIPGNHDINCSAAFAFSGETYRMTDAVTADEFRSIYHAFLGQIEEEQIGISYTVSLTPELDLCMLDCSYYEPTAYTFGYLDKNRLQWYEKQLASAEAGGRQLISATHHSVVPHSSLWQDNFVIINADQIVRALTAHGDRLNLSGHLHIQHISEKDGLYDIASGAFSVYPHHYGLVTVSDQHAISYHALSPDSDLLSDAFMQESEKWFRDSNTVKTRPALEELGLPDDRIEIMLRYAEDIHIAYFSGSLRLNDPYWKEQEGYQLWIQYRDQLSFGAYLELLLSEASVDALNLSIP